jgi:hypothetical protein
VPQRAKRVSDAPEALSRRLRCTEGRVRSRRDAPDEFRWRMGSAAAGRLRFRTYGLRTATEAGAARLSGAHLQIVVAQGRRERNGGSRDERGPRVLIKGNEGGVNTVK